MDGFRPATVAPPATPPHAVKRTIALRTPIVAMTGRAI
jgi:hypothetical protein